MVDQKKLLLGLVLGLAVAWLFFRMCARSGRCLVMNGEAASPLPPASFASPDCYRFDVGDNICQFPEDPSEPAFIPGAYYQDPGYPDPARIGSGQGSIGASLEGFTPDCLGRDPLGTQYPNTNMMPYQIACRPEPVWNLPRDWRVQQQAMYPCGGVPGQNSPPKCQKRHPMDSIYTPPNEGIMTRQVRN